jgi:hypothetical protein
MDILHPEFTAFLSCAAKFQLRYMVIGGYAVNYYGYIRNTHDLDIWIAPTNENKRAFIEVLLCMGYSENEISPLQREDFTQPFKADIGEIDVLTFVHPQVSYDDAEKEKVSFIIQGEIIMQLVPYNFLVDIKVRAARDKDLWDVSKLKEINDKKL